MQPDTNRFFFGIHTAFFLGLDRPRHSVYDCHPPKVVPMVKLIEKLRSGEKIRLDLKPSKKGKKPVSAILLYGTAKGLFGNT